MFSAKKILFFFILFLLQMSTASEFFPNVWFKTIGILEKIAKRRNSAKIPSSNTLSSKLVVKNMLQFAGNFLNADSAQKMKNVSKQWSNMKIYDNVFPNEFQMMVFKNVNTDEIPWEVTEFKKLWFWQKTVPKPEKLVLHLRRNDPAKWNDVFVWFVENRGNLLSPIFINKTRNAPFLKELMLAIAENVDVTFTHQGKSPLMFAYAIDDPEYIRTLVQRGIDVNQQDNEGYTALHIAAARGNMNVCTTLLENDANIDAADRYRWTPLIIAAINGRETVYAFLIEKGADAHLTSNDGRTALQFATFRVR